jgi:CelD/BcsL family acetyltransferase involved in cellulose biosynthesis
LGPVSGTNEAWQSFPQEFNSTGARLRVECDARAVHTLFRLPQSQSEYLNSLSKNEQKNRRKYELRTLRKEHAVEVSVISGTVETLLQEFDHFVELHGRQWQAEGKAGHFGAWPNALAYNRALVEALGPLDRVRFIRITADRTVVSSQYLFSFGGRWYWELPARLPGRDWDRFSLGPSGIVTMIGEAISTGVHWIQGGLGHYDYKLRLGAEEYGVVTFRICPSGVGPRLRRALYDWLRLGLRFCYHKVWYRRIVPRLPGPVSRSQWPLWLRVDF